jgi:hypothetical protein
VTVTLVRNERYVHTNAKPGPVALAFALPVAPGAIAALDRLEILVAGKPLEAKLRALLPELRSVLVELPAAEVRLPAQVEVRFAGAPHRVVPSAWSFRAAAKSATVGIETATYGVESRGTSSYAAVPRARKTTPIFESVEAPVRAEFPPGYLAHTRILGDVMPAPELEAHKELTGMSFLSTAIVHFADSAMGISAFPLHPASISFETEAWLYDRCATYLLAYAHAGESRHLAHALESCAHYAREIGQAGEERGIFLGKKERDTKYSHARGVYAYYALTGDEVALDAGRAIAEMWQTDPLFAVPYRAGYTRGIDKLWTERLLAASIEGGVYGYLLTGEKRFLEDARGLVKTALRHITTNDPAELKTITKTAFPAQSCFIHNALQQAEGNDDIPWCSSWMSELVVDPLLRFQEVTGERGVDEVFVRLARSMRDVGTMYFKDNPLNDAFLAPSRPFVIEEEPRLLAPLYGYGIDESGKRRPSGEWSDFEHCADATAVTAAALRALRRQGRFDAPPAPASAAYKVDLSRFKSDGESILALHHELAFCAQKTFETSRRENRDPRTASQTVLANAYGAGDDAARAKALEGNKIGWPVYNVVPMRKLSWWFNTSIGQFSWLAEAKVSIPALRPGQIR